MASKIITFVNGNLHPPARNFAGYILLVVGFIGMVFGGWASVFLFLVGIYLAFSKFGTEIKLETEMYREFSSIVGIKTGTWHHLNRYPYLCILKTRIVATAFSLSNRNTDTGSEDYFEVYLLSESHHHRILLKRCNTLEEAEASGVELAQKLDKPLVDFSPVRTTSR